MPAPRSGFFDVLLLCLRSTCPVCAQGRLYKPFLRVRGSSDFFLPVERCAGCGFRFRREPGYYFGVVTPVLPILAVGNAIGFALGAYLVRGPDRDAILSAASIGLLSGLILLFRSAVAIYIAIDHSIDPPG